jgi:hypothetical protein
MFFHQSDQFVTDFCTVITENCTVITKNCTVSTKKLHCDYRKLHCDYRKLHCCLGLTTLKSTNHSRVISLCILLAKKTIVSDLVQTI